jgi:hypothetical protein
MTRAGAPNDLSRAVDDLYAENDTLRRLLADAHDELPWCECRAGPQADGRVLVTSSGSLCSGVGGRPAAFGTEVSR